VAVVVVGILQQGNSLEVQEGLEEAQEEVHLLLERLHQGKEIMAGLQVGVALDSATEAAVDQAP
jgi:hypothetical protein